MASPAAPLRISGVQAFTLLDFPGRVACVLFLPGCNFRCGFCHNPEFVLPEELVKSSDSWISEDDVLSFLSQRKGKLDGVVISGGEPTIHPGLEAFIRRVRDLGFQVKLDTNGNKPDTVKRLLDEHLLEYVAMDVKTSLERYGELVGPCVRPENIRESIRLIMERAPEYEFRTTVVPAIHGDAEWHAILDLIRGAKRYALQGFRPGTVLDAAFGAFSGPEKAALERIADLFRPHVVECIVR